MTGYIQDNGRLLDSAGTWTRSRKSDPSRDFFPPGFEAVTPALNRTVGIAYQANGTAMSAARVNQIAFYACERSG